MNPLRLNREGFKINASGWAVRGRPTFYNSEAKGDKMYKEALKLRDAGLSIIPINKNKIPSFSLLPQIEVDGKMKGTWNPFKERLATDEELYKWFNIGTAFPAIVGGEVSGQLYQMDFDDHNDLGCVFDAWKRLVSEVDANILLAQLVIHQTPGGGYHVRWRVDTSEPLDNKKLAERWLTDEHGQPVFNEKGKRQKEAIIESKGEGGYCLCPPSPGYKRIQGSLLDIPIISYKSHQLLVSIAKAFHSAIEKPAEKKPNTKKGRTSHGLSPGDDFDKRGDHKTLLEKHGWTLAHTSGDVQFFKRPGSEHAWGATWNYIPDRFYCWSTNAEFDYRQSYNKFAMYAILECDSDFTLAAKKLAAEGYGEQRKPEKNQQTEKQRTTKRQPILLTGEDRYAEIKALIEQHFRKGTQPDKIYSMATDRNAKQCQPPIPDDEIIALINSLKPRLPTQTGTELLAKDIPPPKWAVEDFIPEGLTIFAGKPKIGKSWLMLGISLSVALGGKALGEIDVEGGEVLYCALEDNERRLQTRLEILLPDGARPDRFHYIALGDLPKMDKGGLDMIGTFLDDMPNTRLVVIDTLQKFKAHGNSKRNAYEEDYDVFGVLQQFAMSRGIALVLIHHMRKADAEYELDEISGSTGATGASDSILILKRSVDGPTLYRQGRDVIEETFAVEFDLESCIWTLQGEAKEVHMSKARQQIVQVLEGTIEGMTAKTLAGTLGKNYNTVRNLITKLIADGTVIKAGTHYLIPRDMEDDDIY